MTAQRRPRPSAVEERLEGIDKRLDRRDAELDKRLDRQDRILDQISSRQWMLVVLLLAGGVLNFLAAILGGLSAPR